MRNRIGYWVLGITAFIAVLSLLFIEPFTQDPAYHNFIDQREILHIPNFWNVLSNFPFILLALLAAIKPKLNSVSKIQFYSLFVGIGLIGLGSAYYHLNPNNETLVWDRLPMTIAFMSIFSIAIAEFISKRVGRILFWPLILLGLSSVLQWHFSTSGDLRFYALIQFYPMLALPIILIAFKKAHSIVWGYWLMLLCYIIAKVFEYLDAEIYEFIGLLSGHSLKHFMAALGLFLFYSSLKVEKVKTD